MKLVTVSIPNDTVRALDDKAKRVLRSRSNLVRAVLEQWLSNAEAPPIANKVARRAEQKGR